MNSQNVKELKQLLDQNGIKVSFLAEKMNVTRTSLANKFNEKQTTNFINPTDQEQIHSILADIKNNLENYLKKNQA